MLSALYLTITLITILLAIIYSYLKSCYKYWEHRNIPYLQPSLLLGNANDLILGRKSILEYQKQIYEHVKHKKLLGLFMFQKPTLYISDVDWIKSILIRDSALFYDRGIKIDTTTEPLTRHLFHLEGDEYKAVRHKVMPAFTLNGVLLWFPLLMDSAMNLKHYLKQVSQQTEDLDLKDIMSRYAAEVIGKCAFGLQKGPLTGDNEKFYKMSKKIFLPRLRTIIKLILPRLPNFIIQLFDIKMIETEVSDYFSGIIRDEIHIRRKQNKRPNDFLSFMLDLQDRDDEYCEDIMPITDELIMANCFMLFIAGYENTTGILCASLFELARNPNVQEKLYTEIRDTCFVDDNFELNFDKMSKMNYLQMVICEVLRLYPPATALIRESAQDYQLPGSDIIIDKGLQIVIPVCGINTDPTYYPYADSFNPENFSEEAKKARSRYTFIPFGEGPRACAGRKFGMIQMKIALTTLLLYYEFFPSPKMHLPVKFEKKTFITSIEGGAWVRCKPRCH